MFGNEFVNFSIHLLIHLVAQVKERGPIFTHSAFTYEHFIGVLLDFVTGTHHATIRTFSAIELNLQSKYLLSELKFEENVLEAFIKLSMINKT